MHHLSRRTLLAATTAGVAATALGAVPAQASKGTSDQALKKIISGMSLEEKVGQLFVMRVYGHSADAPDQADIDANLKEIGVRTADELIDKYKLGGIIYFQWAHNVRDPHQTADLSNGIQRAGQRQPSRIPLLIATDQEHGIVCRVGKPATLFPGAMALGAGGSHSDARKAGQLAGAELRALGIVQDYAPDADVNVNPANPVIGVRSFGADPDAVAGLVAAQVKGYQSAGIASTAKHFPGHGDTATDSHTGLPVITHTREQWEQLDRPSFEAAIAAGIDSIMTAHIVVPALDPAEDPATLSRPILTGILREQLGYDGVVITDSLGMEGVRTKYGDARVPVLALQAGVDQLLNPPTLDVSWNAVLDAVKSGELTEARLDESILRILRLKAKLGLFKAKEVYVSHSGVDRTVGTRAHLAAADRIAERTTTLLVNKEKLLPLSRRTHKNVLVLGANPASPSLSDGPPTTVIGAALTERGFSATVLATGTAPSQAVIDQAVAAAAGKDAVVIGTYNVTAGSTQQKLVNAVAATGVPVVTLSVRNPYDVAQLGAADAHVAAYSWIDVELRAAVRVLTGAARPRGRLPVPVQRADDPTQVLYPIGYGLRY
ncbi:MULTISPECIES: glycoside hydrolase family 3 protein [unclassified Streptomyces]|uniref:glycoside hydrolase family 3 protein n=1 Tax=unclassified Streptomyces TaxID=2593676 RepID=UPI000DBA6706|nr:glycoside hydrolase family 3 protein [Streptomyces sp. PsTaAH-137]MYT71425.1 glycoside hydrolase family 3 protein [Streptomyces sp. SID8367]RAJ82886.1 beta-N-acetylhexosaminidase [Streptomyces sp. PsTaAH-137]